MAITSDITNKVVILVNKQYGLTEEEKTFCLEVFSGLTSYQEWNMIQEKLTIPYNGIKVEKLYSFFKTIQAEQKLLYLALFGWWLIGDGRTRGTGKPNEKLYSSISDFISICDNEDMLNSIKVILKNSNRVVGECDSRLKILAQGSK